MRGDLSGPPLFIGGDRRDVRAPATLHPVEFPRRHVFFEQGEPGERLYLVVSGMVKLCRTAQGGQAHLFAIVGPADMFGECSVFDPGPRASSATAVTDVCAVVLDRDDVRSWMAGGPVIAERLMQVLANRLRRADDDRSHLTFTDVTGRVAKLLLRLGHQFGVWEDGEIRVTHDFTQEELGQLIGTCRTTVNKVLLGFCHRGWIRVDGRSFVINDADGLARRARLC